MSEVDEGIFVRVFLVFMGISLMMMGFMALMVSHSRGLGSGGGFVVVIGPFIFAAGENVPPEVTVALVLISLALILALIYVVRRWVGGSRW